MPLPEFESFDLAPHELSGISKIRPAEEDIPDTTAPPLISEATTAYVNAFYNLDGSRDGSTTENRPWFVGWDVAMTYFQHVQFANPINDEKLADMYSGLFDKFFEDDVGQINGASIGVGYILFSFHQQLGDGFLERLQRVDFKKAGEAILTSLMPPGKFIYFADRGNILKSHKLRKFLPAHQQELNEGVSLLKQQSNCQPCIEYGAVSAYNAIDAMWEEMSKPLLQIPGQIVDVKVMQQSQEDPLTPPPLEQLPLL